MAPQNSLPIHGNERTMNLNSMILTNIQASPYFKVKLFDLKTYHEVIDEIYYRVEHLEPWEKGSRKTSGQTGMCGGVRGVGAGGIVSSSFCLLFKLFTLRLTHKQLQGLITHSDSPYIRALGFMYIRYTQPPAKLWEWYEEYLEDEEEIDVKAGGGHVMQIGEMLRQWMTKLEWYSTLFPRIPVPIQKEIESYMEEFEATRAPRPEPPPPEPEPAVWDGARDEKPSFGEAERVSHLRKSGSPPRVSQTRERDDHRRDPPRKEDRRDDRRDGRRDDRKEDKHRDDRKEDKHRDDKHRDDRRRDDQHRDDRGDRRDKVRQDDRRDRHREDRRDPLRRRSPSPPRRASPSAGRHDRRDERTDRRSRSRDHKRARPSHSRDDKHAHGRDASSFERDLKREKSRQQKRHRDDY